MSSLADITVADGNPRYHSDGNCLIETETKTLTLGCVTSVIPNDGTVTVIGESSFIGLPELKSISIPESVTDIGMLSFAYCKNLVAAHIPSSVTCIDDSAFLNDGNVRLYCKAKSAAYEYAQTHGFPCTITGVIGFEDVVKGSWYYDAVAFVVDRELFNGISKTEFAPDKIMTRAMLVTVLWRLDGRCV